ncbi:MAG TPA: amidohydrolase family protein, partial [Gammaproteobacteria bacterium]|nr:amidohydrolase family protein [Gammaproteobacteria bacterium]
LDAGINVGIGTDGAVSNNDLDMLGEMRSAALLAKVYTKNPKALDATTVLRMATLNNAKALGLDKEIGSIKIGKSADIIAVNIANLSTVPIYHPISQLVYAVNRQQITDVWVAGKQLVQNRKLMTLDQNNIIKNSKMWGEKIANATTY